MYITVTFEEGGKEYVYTSPFELRVHDLILVSVYGSLKVAKVRSISTQANYHGPIKSIVGLAYLLEDLEQPEVVKQSWLDRLIG